MHKLPRFKVLVYFGIFIVAVSVIPKLGFVKEFVNLIKENYGNEANDTKITNVFSGRQKEIITEKTPLAPEVEAKFENNPDEYLEYKYAWGVISIPKEADWDYKKIPILATIENVDLQSKKLTIRITKPSYSAAIGKTKNFDLNMCNDNNSYFYVEDTTITHNLKFLESLESNMQLLTFCADSKCNNFERLCKFFF